jgi:hypothetical protein
MDLKDCQVFWAAKDRTRKHLFASGSQFGELVRSRIMKKKRLKAISRRRNKRRARIRIRHASSKSSPTGRRPKQQRKIRIRRGSKSKSNRKSARLIRVKRSSRKAKRIRVKRMLALSPRELNSQSPTHEKALAALGLMRRVDLSLAKATRSEHIKPSTFLRHVGDAVYRSGPGKPWKARKSDDLKARMRVLTPKGPVYDVVRGSRERTRNARYEIALRAFRAAEDGAVEELKKFEGLTVGGHVLVTDLNQLIQLEEVGKLDFDNLYYSVGDRS